MDSLNELSVGCLPGYLGTSVTHIRVRELVAELSGRPGLMTSNGFLHAGSVVTLADTCPGYGCRANLPDGASGFTTLELKSNHLGMARGSTLVGGAMAAHSGRSTQVRDAVVTHKERGHTLALFRCTRRVLYPPRGA
ncbi:MAG TPA: PaaI family thioesterase [Rhodanobacter sp.]|nr:PaaI family thioesterase [Rhodanobacter sp.]